MEICKKIFATSAFFLFAVTVQSQSDSVEKMKSNMENPLLQRSTLQYQAPPFDKITDEHFKPAFEYGLKVHDNEVDEKTQCICHLFHDGKQLYT